MSLPQLVAEREAEFSALTDKGFAGMDTAVIASVKGHYQDFLRETAKAAYLLGLEDAKGCMEGSIVLVQRLAQTLDGKLSVIVDIPPEPQEFEYGVYDLKKLEEKIALTKTGI